VRHASGTINHNLVYENKRGGIRFGDHITEISNNTVVKNGRGGWGGGIVYDDLIGSVNDDPSGEPPLPLNIRNNICAYNQKGGIRACFVNTEGSEERDFNLAYANNETGETDCGYPDSLSMSCINRNFGGCGGKWNVGSPPVVMDGENNLIGDPMFVNMDLHDYRLQSSSPAKNAGDDGKDMGAYGGDSPIDW
jgi:hypothetical protein